MQVDLVLMGYFDLVIIYLACGAPFGVYELTIARRTESVAFRSLAAIVLWPLYAVRHLKTFFEPDARLRNEVRRIREDLEEAAFAKASPHEIFEFREAYDQFTGLAAAVNERPAPHDLFTATVHPDPALASVCLARKNHAKVAFHLHRSGKDLMRLIARFDPESNESVASILDELGSVVGSLDLAHKPLLAEADPASARQRRAVAAAIDRS